MLRRLSASTSSAHASSGGGGSQEADPGRLVRAAKWETQRGLLVCFPQILGHLRFDGINDPMLFLHNSADDKKGASEALASFFSSFEQHGELSVKRARELCCWKSVRILCCAIRSLVENLEQPLIPPAVCLNLLKKSLEFARPFENRADAMSTIIQEMPAWRFDLVSIFCALLKDCKASKADLARDLGPVFLLPKGVTKNLIPMSKLSPLHAEDARNKDEMAAADVFKAMIEECDLIFGDAAML